MIEYVAEIDSTNAELARRLRAGERMTEGTWLVARRQSGGRGRQGRSWESLQGNFAGSCIVRPRAGDPTTGSLSFVAALATHGAVAQFLPDIAGLTLKWPNDLLLDGGKLAGILLEGEQGAVIAGIGVNLAGAPAIAGRKTACLADRGEAPEIECFAAVLAECFAEELARWRAAGLAALFARWLAAAHPEGTPLAVQEPGGATLNGTFAGLEADGALRLRLADGSCRAIHAADVEV